MHEGLRDLADSVSCLSDHCRIHVIAAGKEIQSLREAAQGLLQSLSGGIKIVQ